LVVKKTIAYFQIFGGPKTSEALTVKKKRRKILHERTLRLPFILTLPYR